MRDNPDGNQVKYVVISPVRNEERCIEGVLRSMINQTILPQAWVIVDDGSTDRTAEIIAPYVQQYPFIKFFRKEPVVKAKQKGYIGLNHAAAVKTFNYGISRIDGVDFGYIAKVDGDISFDKDYFERLLKEFEKNPRLGIVSGRTLNFSNGKLSLEKVDGSSILHQACIYRRQCFEDIGGLSEVIGWDTIDELRAQMKGWQTRNFDDINMIHWRLMGSVGGIRNGKIRHGFTSYYVGYHPLYMIVRSIRRMASEPYIVGGLYLLWGFALGYIKRAGRFPDPEMREFLRSEQIKRLSSMRFFKGLFK